MVNTLENEYSLGVTCVCIVDALCLASIQPFLNLVSVFSSNALPVFYHSLGNCILETSGLKKSVCPKQESQSRSLM